MKIKIFSFVFTLLLIISSLPLNAFAEDKTDFPSTSKAQAVCLYNFETDSVVYTKDMDKKIFPAGAVKMLTGLLACELLEERLSDTVTVTEKMLEESEGINIKLKSGMTVTVENLLYGVLCGNGNDAALVLANICGESVDGFVSMMNDKCDEWGLKDTKITNPTGIDDEAMYSTLFDIMIIAKRASKNELYMKISSTPSYVYTPLGTTDEIKFFNRNCLISTFYSLDYKNLYAEGLISSNTDLGGYSVITYAQKGGTRYICAVMGAASDDEHIYSYKIANDMLEYAFDNFAYMKIAEAGKFICTVPTELSMPQSGIDEISVSCVIGDDVYALTHKSMDIESDLTYRYYLHNDILTAPVSAGVIVGGVDIIYNGETIGHALLITEEDIEASGILVFLEKMKDFFIGRFFLFSLLFFVIFFMIYYYFVELRFRRKNAKNLKYRNFY